MAFIFSETSVNSLALIAGLVTVLCFILKPNYSREKNKVYELRGLNIVSAWQFFSKRYDFIWQSFKQAGENCFQFRILHHKVVAVSGEEGRKAFFNDKSLNFTEGYKLLMGGVPTMETINIEEEHANEVSWFNKQLLLLLNKKRLDDVVPLLLDDINTRMVGWGKEGKINPFKDVNDLVFQMTVRMATCKELSTDIQAVQDIAKLFWTLEKSSTPVALVLPWFPGSAKKAKKAATTELYLTLMKYVDMRRNAKVPSSDAFDVMIAEGHTNDAIIGFTFGVIFAGVVNTGMMSCWLLIYLASNPEWKQRITREISSLIATHCAPSPSTPRHILLSEIPVSAWEDSLPSLDLAIRETIRIVLTGAALRRNVLDEVRIGEKVVDRGTFMVYSLGDVHLNGEIYRDPKTFDPSRFEEGREEDKKGFFTYLGWGAGRHPCTGMKVAKLELKMITALFLSGYEYDLVDASGKYPSKLPEPDRNDFHTARPVGDTCYLKFKRTVD